MKIKWIAALVVVVGVAAFGILQVQDAGAAQEASSSAEGGNYTAGGTVHTAQGTTGADVQPINFPHSVHSGTYQMDCQYCHYSAARSNSAGMPPISSCMGCHTMIAGEQRADQISKLREYWNEGETVPWVRIHKVADHVHFPHLRHVNAGLECAQCHGPVEEYENAIVEPHPNWGKGKMGWCISCHVNGPDGAGSPASEEWEQVSRDCTVCHY